MIHKTKRIIHAARRNLPKVALALDFLSGLLESLTPAPKLKLTRKAKAKQLRTK